MKAEITRPPVAETKMLVRRPVAEVFEAFLDPAITSRFWFSHASARLQAGRQVRWDWPLYERLAVAMKMAAQEVGVPLEWGGDWRSFKDGPHFQLPWQTHP